MRLLLGFFIGLTFVTASANASIQQAAIKCKMTEVQNGKSIVTALNLVTLKNVSESTEEEVIEGSQFRSIVSLSDNQISLEIYPIYNSNPDDRIAQRVLPLDSSKVLNLMSLDANSSGVQISTSCAILAD